MDEGTLSRELRTAGLLQPRVSVGDQWQNIGIRPILLSYQVSTQLRVAPPTDPYVLTLEHTVLQIMDSLRV